MIPHSKGILHYIHQQAKSQVYRKITIKDLDKVIKKLNKNKGETSLSIPVGIRGYFYMKLQNLFLFNNINPKIWIYNPKNPYIMVINLKEKHGLEKIILDLRKWELSYKIGTITIDSSKDFQYIIKYFK